MMISHGAMATSNLAQLANDGLDAAHSAGIAPHGNCQKEIAFDNTSGGEPVVASGSGDFCSNPVGNLCANVKTKISERMNLRSSSEIVKFAAVHILQRPSVTASITSAFNEAQRLITKKIDTCTECTEATKKKMRDSIKATTFNICPAPTEAGTPCFSACGSDGLGSNAFNTPSGNSNTVNLCLGKILSSCPPNYDYVANEHSIGAYLFGTLSHELGHSIHAVSQTTETPKGTSLELNVPWNGILSCMKKADDSLYQSKNMLSYLEPTHETIADFWSAAAMSEYAYTNLAVKGRASLCESSGGGDGEHPFSTDRIKWLRAFPSIATKMCGGNTPANSCMDKGWVK